MGLSKYGTGKILPEPDDDQKTAKKAWSDEDEEALREENERADDGKGKPVPREGEG